jgi:hypothetical protein
MRLKCWGNRSKAQGTSTNVFAQNGPFALTYGRAIARRLHKVALFFLTLYNPESAYRNGEFLVVNSGDFLRQGRKGGVMKKRLLVFASALLWATASQATTINFTAALLGANENPPTASLGTGYALVTLDDILDTLRVQVTFSGLTTPNTAAHIHCCAAPPANAGVATVTPTFTGFPTGALAGTYDHTFDLSLASSYNPAFVTAQGGLANANAALINGLENNLTYLNIHTQMFGGGEIRGFLAATPEPTTLLLLGSGLVVGVRRFRRR